MLRFLRSSLTRGLLLLATVALLCTAVGQLTAVLERLDSHRDQRD